MNRIPAQHRAKAFVIGAVLLIVLFAVAVWTEPAMAQSDGEWVKPAEGIIKALQSGLVTAGLALADVGIIALGIWGAVTGRMDWGRFGYVILGGVLVMAGPRVIAALLEIARQQ